MELLFAGGGPGRGPHEPHPAPRRLGSGEGVGGGRAEGPPGSDRRGAQASDREPEGALVFQPAAGAPSSEPQPAKKITKAGPRLVRETFSAPRSLDFYSEDGLRAETGHGPEAWPLVILKELVDNALDACEEAGIAPEIAVTVG